MNMDSLPQLVKYNTVDDPTDCELQTSSDSVTPIRAQ